MFSCLCERRYLESYCNVVLVCFKVKESSLLLCLVGTTPNLQCIATSMLDWHFKENFCTQLVNYVYTVRECSKLNSTLFCLCSKTHPDSDRLGDRMSTIRTGCIYLYIHYPCSLWSDGYSDYLGAASFHGYQYLKYKIYMWIVYLQIKYKGARAFCV